MRTNPVYSRPTAKITMSSATVCNCPLHRTLRIPHVLRQRVPDSRASNRKRPTSVGTEPVSWYRLQRPRDYWQNVDVGGNCREKLACSGRSGTVLVVLASVHKHAELVFDTFRNVNNEDRYA